MSKMAGRSQVEFLNNLRSLMKNSKKTSERITAYIIPTDDAHQNEYIADSDKRRAFLSGFTGSAGTAIVTEKQAALWTDGRYHVQANSQLDHDHWILMKDGLPDTLTQGDWLKKVLPHNSQVGVDTSVLSAAAWKPLKKELELEGHSLVPITSNLVDAVWTDQPARPENSIIVHPLKYTGQKWQEKVQKVREKMSKKEAYCYVVTALDEIAWLLNLRGSDIQFNPCFFAYVIVTMDEVMLFVDSHKLSPAVEEHLGLGPANSPEVKVTVHPYGAVHRELEKLVELKKGKVWVSLKSSYSLYSLVPKQQRVAEYSPVAQLKAIKNETERQGMRNAHIRDAVAMCEYFVWLEREVPKGNVTEISASDQLQKFREAQEDYVSLSFDTISSIGADGAVIHYKAVPETDKPLNTDEVYLVDSGAQYRDGTTDITRTVHLGTPSEYEKECFTRVLKGHIRLATIIFPKNVKGIMLDSFARAALWESGLDYLHGTGHGVGSFLNVHEGPCGIGFRPRPDDMGLAEHMVLSNEPGYYEHGKFGMRIENLVIVTKADTKYNFMDKGFLTFETIALVPLQKKMLVPELLTEKEVEWLNSYHLQCREVVGAALKEQGKMDAYKWLLRETEPLG